MALCACRSDFETLSSSSDEFHPEALKSSPALSACVSEGASEVLFIPIAKPETEPSVKETEIPTSVADTSQEPIKKTATSPEEQKAIKCLIADYLKYGRTEDDPTVWADIDRLYDCSDMETISLWADILSRWEITIKDGHTKDIESIELPCYVVLGYRLKPDGTADKELIDRLDKAVALYQQNNRGFILCSGGNTTNTVSEASIMKDYLIKKDIPAEKILTEARSQSTVQNVLYSYEILQKHNLKNIIVITSKYHLTGAAALFDEMFLLAGSDMQVISTIGNPSDKPEFSEDTLCKWAYDLFLLTCR
jgi:hypothetical protein